VLSRWPYVPRPSARRKRLKSARRWPDALLPSPQQRRNAAEARGRNAKAKDKAMATFAQRLDHLIERVELEARASETGIQFTPDELVTLRRGLMVATAAMGLGLFSDANARAVRDRLDTLGKLHQRGHGIGGYCLICRELFAVDMAALVAERGADSPIVGMKPLRCPSCGGVRTERRVTVAPKR
jgi:hypothetical protein